MGAFGGLIQTNKGRNLQAKAEAGAQLKFTRMGIGDGQLGGQSIPSLNKLIHETMSLPITRLKPQLPAQAIVGAVLSNQDVTTGFYFRELGIFAQDPDEGEILYAYGNSGSGAEYIPPKGTADIIEKTIDMIVTFGQAQNVSAVINSSLIFATPDDVETALEEAKQYTDTAVAGVKVPDASLRQKGITQLSSAIDSTSEAMAATPKAVKAAYDRGSAGVTAAATAQSRADSAYSEATAAKQLGVEQKANVVAALNSIGVSASTNETWAQLVAKMAGVIRATGNADPADVLAGKTFSNASGNGLTGTMPNYSRSVLGQSYRQALSIKGDGGGSIVVEPATGYYEQGKNAAGFGSIIASDNDYVPSNIKKGTSIFGVEGTLVPLTTEKKVVYGTEYYSLRSQSGRPAYVFNRVDFRPSRVVLLFTAYVSIYNDGSDGRFVPYYIEATSNRTIDYSDWSCKYSIVVGIIDNGFTLASTFTNYATRPETNNSNFILNGWYMIS